MLNLQAMLAERLERRAAEYQENAPAVCEEYGLDAQADKRLVGDLIRMKNQLAICAKCTGEQCAFGNYVQPYARGVGKDIEVYSCECAYGRHKRLTTWAKKFVPKRYADKTFADYEVTAVNRRAVGMARWFLEKGDRGLYFYGGVGTGKTFLASLIAKEYAAGGKETLGRKLVFGDVPSLLDEIKKTFNDPNASSQQVLSKFIKCDLLILDDIGTGKLSEWNTGLLYQIINERYNEEKPIILTSNYTLEQLGEKLSKVDAENGARITSRLRGTCYFASLGTEDRRRLECGTR